MISSILNYNLTFESNGTDWSTDKWDWELDNLNILFARSTDYSVFVWIPCGDGSEYIYDCYDKSSDY